MTTRGRVGIVMVCGKEIEPGLWEDEFDADWFRYENPIKEFDGYCVRYTYSDQDGTCLERVWGLVKE